MRAVQIFRRKNPRFFSIESVFMRIREAWDLSDTPGVATLPDSGVSLRNVLFIWRYARKHPADLWHMTGDSTYVVLALPRRKTIVSIHDCGYFTREHGVKARLLKWLLLDLPVRHCTQVHAISEKTREEVVELTGCDASKIRVISNPVSPLLQFSSQDFNVHCPRLLFIGLTPNKNFDRACEAIAGIPSILVIIGKPDTEQAATLERFAIRHEIHHGLTEAEMAGQYAAADIVFFPSLYEGFGLPVIEGFRAGRVVLTSDVRPMRDIGMGAACLVDPENVGSIRAGVLRLIQEETYRNGLILSGRSVAEQYAPETIALAFRSFYQQVIEQACVA